MSVAEGSGQNCAPEVAVRLDGFNRWASFVAARYDKRAAVERGADFFEATAAARAFPTWARHAKRDAAAARERWRRQLKLSGGRGWLRRLRQRAYTRAADRLTVRAARVALFGLEKEATLRVWRARARERSRRPPRRGPPIGPVARQGNLRRLQAAYLVFWVSAIRGRHRNHAIAVCALRRRRRRLGRALVCIAAAAAKRRRDDFALAAGRARALSDLRRACYRSWFASATLTRVGRALRHAEVARAWRSWAEAGAERRRMITAAVWLRDHVRVSALRRWVDVCVEELDVIATRDAVAYRWRHALLREALSEWRWQAAAARWFITAGRHAARRWWLGRAGGAWAVWAGSWRVVAAARAVARRWRAAELAAAFSALFHTAAGARRYAWALTRCRLLRRRHAWPLLRAAVARRREERRKEKLRRVVAAVMSKSLLGAWRVWSATAAARREAYRKMGVGIVSLARRREALGLHTWVDWFVRRRRAALPLIRAAAAFGRRGQRTAFTTWVAAAAERAAWQLRMRGILHPAALALRVALNTWADEARVRAAVDAVRRRGGGERAAASAAAWRSWTGSGGRAARRANEAGQGGVSLAGARRRAGVAAVGRACGKVDRNRAGGRAAALFAVHCGARPCAPSDLCGRGA